MARPDNSNDAQAARRGKRLSEIVRLLAAALAIAAVVKELKKPKAERTWHGTVAGLVPYEFRTPTIERARARLWNPDGPLIGPQLFGVGWTVNFGAVASRIKSMRRTR